MRRYLVLSARFLGDRYHGQTDNGETPEWPPSPFRFFQAIIASNVHAESIPEPLVSALQWLELLSPPDIIAPQSRSGRTLLTYVLNNRSDRSRTPKPIRPMLLNDDRLIQYIWEFDSSLDGATAHAHTIIHASRHLRALGWGIDLAIGHGEIADRCPFATERRLHYRPCSSMNLGGSELWTPHPGSLRSLQDNHSDVLRRYESPGITRLESGGVVYQPQYYAEISTRPYVVFELRNEDDTRFSYPQAQLIHLAGMVRHLAIELMRKSPPEELPERFDNSAEWVRSYVAGHRDPAQPTHRQFSYLPLPSIGHAHTDPAVRRVMIAAPLGDDRPLAHLAKLLSGQRLKPTSRTKLDHPPTLVRVHRRGENHRKDVIGLYTSPATNWASVTPVILPGHNDRKPDKTRKLIESALRQSGIDQPCEFDWSPFSRFPKSLSAYKYDRDKRPTGYIRPDHLLSQTAVHLRLQFNDGVMVPGPLVIGAGRHCGLGLFAAET